MNNDYGQQFMQNLKAQPVQPPNNEPNNSKTPLIVIIILAVALLFESIILIVLATNNSTLISKINSTESEDVEEEISDDVESDYSFDKEGNLTAINLECKTENGSSYTLSTNNSYKSYDAATQSATSGTYTITRDSIIHLSGSSNKTIFYDGLIIADGTNVYECEGELNAIENDTE